MAIVIVVGSFELPSDHLQLDKLIGRLEQLTFDAQASLAAAARLVARAGSRTILVRPQLF